jgi:hypothetical protein
MRRRFDSGWAKQPLGSPGCGSVLDHSSILDTNSRTLDATMLSHLELSEKCTKEVIRPNHLSDIQTTQQLNKLSRELRFSHPANTHPATSHFV